MRAREIDFLGVHILERNVNFNFVILVSFWFSYFICLGAAPYLDWQF